MLPSSITALSRRADLAHGQVGSAVMHVGSHGASGTGSLPAGLGPLARRSLALLGMGVDGQSRRSAGMRHLQQAFAAHPLPGAGADAWLAGRALPTPRGYLRETMPRPEWLR